MSAESDTDAATEFGSSSGLGWPIGGALGGAVGALAFGVLVWLFDPEVVEATIPAIYGLEPGTLTGWAVHVAHGIVLGVVFGFLVTRPAILGVLRSDVETDALSETGVSLRIVAAGFAFGLAVWAILPVIVLPVWSQTIGASPGGEFPIAAAESLLGHVVFGIVLGVVFAATVDLHDRSD
ncbi:hypothetical protein [Salinilacihabitans rarus]|uniref:hypothetical protein n=1 Tax=Salinilacihabitans rarus TaxID=2961596 RepID=UPI0020C8F868|nr:hypothetical protein [Salinilacihabitans rarus]